MQEPQTWPEITAIASAVSQAQLQLVQNLLLLSKHFFCKTKRVHRVGRGPAGQRRLRAGGFPTLLQPCTESSPSSYSEVQQVPPGRALWEAGWGQDLTPPTHPSSTLPPNFSRHSLRTLPTTMITRGLKVLATRQAFVNTKPLSQTPRNVRQYLSYDKNTRVRSQEEKEIARCRK